MKFLIPKEYRPRFQGTCYISRWKNNGILIMDKKGKDILTRALDGSRVCCTGGIIRFMKASIFKVECRRGEIEVPEFIRENLQEVTEIIPTELGLSLR